MMRIGIVVFGALALMPTAASAQEREFCSDRPGIGTPACTVSPGQVYVEAGIGDWTLERSAGERDDTFLTGDFLVRYGVADHAEVQIGWTALGFSRERAAGTIDHRSAAGDVTLAMRRNLANPDGSGFSVAVMPFVTLPVGREPIGAGDWSAGALVPLSYELSDKVNLAATTEIDAAVDEDGSGRHLAFSEVVGASLQLAKTLTATAEYQVMADHDPQGHKVQHLSGLSLGWQPEKKLQFDVGANAGLDHDAPEVEVYFGVSRRF
ncbi:transporter [Novosphingobium sp. P6W]|uniref:transporter n=1 Tax=Novosphingobium sp. P6W TaxID=1609758 RepID=UPI0006971F32|nr:transporter [Novosphingobium sp. P6W]AXB79515.1 transporter [Novosphingobium sp. P6W]